jgi:hypothetical protein
MAKRDTLREKLKAADRRRQRRSAESPAARGPELIASPSGSPISAPRVDVVGLIVREILDHAESLGQEARDAIVIAALKASLNATTPSGPDARQLLQQLERIPSQSGVSLREFREAIQQLLSQATATPDSRRSNDAFLRYLVVVAA